MTTTSITIGPLKLERLGSTVIVYSTAEPHELRLTAAEWSALELAAASLSVAERRAEDDRQEIARLQVELARFAPLASVLRNWDWKAIAEDGYWRQDYERAIEQLVKAMAEVEKANGGGR